MNPNVNTPALVQAVRQHAQAHYEQDGWDYVVETMDDADIAAIIDGVFTPASAIKRVHKHVKMLNSVRKDIQGTAF